MYSNVGYHTYFNLIKNNIFSSTHANTCTQNVFCTKSPPQLGLFIISVNIRCGAPIWTASR